MTFPGIAPCQLGEKDLQKIIIKEQRNLEYANLKNLVFYSKPHRFFKIIFKLNDESKLIAAYLYHHRSFTSGYKIKFKKSSNIVSTQLKKETILSLHIMFIRSMNENGISDSFSELRNKLNHNNNKNVIFNNYEIELFISNSSGDNIPIIYSERKNESMFFVFFLCFPCATLKLTVFACI